MTFNELLNDEGVIFTLTYYAFKVLTWGYIPHILLGLFIAIGIMFLIILIKERKMPLFIFRENYSYTRHFLFLFLIEKFTYVKYHIIESKYFLANHNDFRFWLMVGIIGTIVTIILLFGWNFANEVFINTANEKLNETITNISTNNS
jgi:hypothetical protein